MRSGFRRAWLADLGNRVPDLVLHSAAAMLLPGPWWLQWCPDVALPALWLRSVLSDKMAPEGSRVLQLHRLLHGKDRDVTMAFAATCVVWTALGSQLATAALAHVAVHLAIDGVTHGEGWQ